MKKILLIITLTLLTGCTTYEENFSHVTVREADYIGNIKMQSEPTEESPEEEKTDNQKEPNQSTSAQATQKPSSSTNKGAQNNTTTKPNTSTTTTNPTKDTTPQTTPQAPFEEDPNKVLMTTTEIENYNATIKSKTTSLYDVKSIENFSQSQIQNYITSYQLPTGTKYNGTTQITEEMIGTILDNRNLDAITDKTAAQRGIIVKRSNLKSFPTTIHFYNYPNASNFDQIQETELVINTPVRILHQSKDGAWYFVISPIYYGWVLRDDVAIARDSDWQYFINNKSFITVTDSSIKLEGQILDMGVTLPLIKASGDSLQIAIPTKDETGYIAKKNTTIESSHVSIGFLPYTKANIISQAKKYLGVGYSWGGMNSGVDCSSYIMNIFKTFGFQFPRNTSEQKNSIGGITSLSQNTNTQKLSTLNGTAPAILYQPGHTMLYLGLIGGKHSIIHASGSDMKVVISTLDNSSYLSKIDRIVSIPRQ